MRLGDRHSWLGVGGSGLSRVMGLLPVMGLLRVMGLLPVFVTTTTALVDDTSECRASQGQEGKGSFDHLERRMKGNYDTRSSGE